MINVVTQFGAFNNNTNSNYTPFMNAIQQAINNGGDEIYFPPGSYKIKGNLSSIKPVYKSLMSGNTSLPMNIRFYGKGAKIICDTDADEGTVIGKGGGFALWGANITFEDLDFIGLARPVGDTLYGKGQLLQLRGDNISVRNCRFFAGNGGAIQLTGNYSNIDANFFDACNNYPATNDSLGAIQINNSSTNTANYVSVTKNIITNQFYTGICIGNGIETNPVSYLTISDNFIRSNSSSSTNNRSRGIVFKPASNKNITISNNTIEKMDREGIRFTSPLSGGSTDCVISGNIIRDCDLRPISVESAAADGVHKNFVIASNQVINSSDAPNATQLILLDRVYDPVITNNRCIAYPQTTKTTNGIQLNNGCPQGVIVSNSVTGCLNGIVFYSANGTMGQNVVSNSTVGLEIGYGRGASTLGNVIKSCTTGINTSVDAGMHLSGNSILDCVNRYNTSGNPLPEVLTHTGVATSSSFSSYVVKGQLTLGQATVIFYHVYPEDRFLVVPVNGTTDIPGALYVSATNTTSSTVTVRSTFSADNRQFMLVKMFSGG